MPSPVSNFMNAFSRSSFDNWSASRGDDEDEDLSSIASPVRYVREGEYDTEFSAEEAQRRYGDKHRRRSARRAETSFSDSNSLSESSRGLFTADFSSIDGEDHTKRTACSRNTKQFDETYTRGNVRNLDDTISLSAGTGTYQRSVGLDESQSTMYSPNVDDSFSYSRSTVKGTYRSGRSTTGDEKHQRTRRFVEDASNINGSSVGGNGYATDSLAEMLDTSYESQVTNNTGNLLSSVPEVADEEHNSKSTTSGEQREYSVSASAAAFAALTRSGRRADKKDEKRASPPSSDDSDTVESRSWLPWGPKPKTSSPADITHGSADDSMAESSASGAKTLGLHDLCGEATSTDDVAWRNALYLLSIQPHLAMAKDKAGWTPLHVCCLADPPPPEFMVRALLFCDASMARVIDKNGRLPLHILAAASADPAAMKLLVSDYPQAVYKTEKGGLTPLHTCLNNMDTSLTVERMRLLTGQFGPYGESTETNDRILQRRGDHLNLSLGQVSRLTDRSHSPGSALDSFDTSSWRDEASPTAVYPDDIQVCLRKLAQWKRKQRRVGQEQDDSVEVELSVSVGAKIESPAAIPTPGSLHLPLHLAVGRTFSDDVACENEEYRIGKQVPNRIEALRVLVGSYPDALVARDAEGRTPLMTALLNQDCFPYIDILELLLGHHTADYESPPLWAGDILLHKSKNGRYINPAMVATNDTNQLPLHVAAEEMPTCIAAVAAIHSSYPGAVNVRDIRGRTPLHMALRNYQRVQPEPEVVSLLLTDRAAQIPDDDGVLPFDLLIRSAQSLPWKEPSSSAAGSGRSINASKVYKKFFCSTFAMQTGKPWRRQESIAFLHQLKKLPPWLRQQACSAEFVQNILVEEVSSVFTCFLILLHGALLLSLIVTFRLQMDEFTNSLEVSAMYAPLIYGICSVFLIRQICYWLAAAALSCFAAHCVLNMWVWVDLASVVLVIATTLLIHNESGDMDLTASLGTAATGLLWGAVVGYFARFWHGMAVFVGRIVRFASLLVWPFIVTASLVVGFAQMFYTLNLTSSQDSCSESLAGQPLCNVRDSYIVVYYLLLGVPVVDTADEATLSNGSIVLVATFTALLVLIVLNIIVSVVIEASGMNIDDVALASYWEPTLNFVYVTWEWTACSCCRRRGRKNTTRGKNDDDGAPIKASLVYEPLIEERLSSILERTWDVICLAVQGGEKSERGNLWYVGCCTAGKARHIMWPLRIAGLLVAPIWIALGFVSCGLLLPPQVRHWIFCPRERRCSGSSSATAEYSASQIAGMRRELLGLKSMSYERSNDVQRDIQEMKELLYSAMDDAE